MAVEEESANPYLTRFQHFLTRSAVVARRYVEAEGVDAPLSATARERAQNVLSYTLKRVEAWLATRDLLLTMAPKMEMAGYRTEWLPYLADGVAQSQRLGDRAAEATLQFHCGYLYRLISDYAQAQACLSASAAHYVELGDAEGQARALNQLAYLAWQQQQYEEAILFAHKALTLLDDSALEKAMSLSVLGLIATDQNCMQDAEDYHRQALQIRTNQHESRQIAWSLQNIGVTLYQQGQYERAITYYQQAITVLNQLSDLAHKAIVQMNIALVYHAQGEAHKALEMTAIAEQILYQMCDEFNLAKLLTTKGLCYLAVSEWKLAESSFKNSAQLFQKLGHYSWYLNAFDGLGISYLEQAEYEKALNIFELVLAQLPQIEGTLAHRYLATTLPAQLEQARSQQVKKGYSVYVPPRHQDQQPPGGPPQADAVDVKDVTPIPSKRTGA